jgi:hypothetical protein
VIAVASTTSGLSSMSLGERFVVDVVGHRVDERDVRDAGVLQGAADVGDPARRPVARDLGAAGMVVGLPLHPRPCRLERRT